MELEQRVKSLEYEMKILKTEIQRTLLDIQEQILVHYYPSLRAEDTGPSEGTWQSLESIRERKGPPGESRAVPEAPTVLEVSTVLDDPDVTEPPAVAGIKQVTLAEIRAARDGTSVPSDGGSSSTSGGEAGQASVVKLSGWVSNTVKKMGGERTIKLIKACARRGWIAARSAETLLRVASLSSEDDVPEIVAINEVLTALLKLSELLGRGSDIEEALTVIEEASLG